MEDETGFWVVPGKTKPAPRPPSKVAGVADALEMLEARRRSAGSGKAHKGGRRGDLDLDGIR